jgi:SAM-dependent methyltransferase
MGSGPGSRLEENTEMIEFLECFIRVKKIKTILDIGCGDWQYMQAVDLQGCKYIGIDCVQSVVDADTAKFGNENVEFRCGDILECEFPPADMVIIKDVVIHLTNAQIFKLWERVKGYKHVIFVFDDKASNPAAYKDEIETGDFRSLDLHAEPFKFPLNSQPLRKGKALLFK